MFKPEKGFVSPYYLFEQESDPSARHNILDMAPAFNNKRLSSAEFAPLNPKNCQVNNMHI
jgi:hypothetical protein